MMGTHRCPKRPNVGRSPPPHLQLRFWTPENGRPYFIPITGVGRVDVDGTSEIRQLDIAESNITLLVIYQYVAGFDMYDPPSYFQEKTEERGKKKDEPITYQYERIPLDVEQPMHLVPSSRRI